MCITVYALGGGGCEAQRGPVIYPSSHREMLTKADLALGQPLIRRCISFYKPEPKKARLTIFHFNKDGTQYDRGHFSDGPGASMAITGAVSHPLYPNPRQQFRKFN